MAKGVDIIVHSTMHPVMGPDRDSGLPPPIFYRQSGTTDLGALAKPLGAKYLMLERPKLYPRDTTYDVKVLV